MFDANMKIGHWPYRPVKGLDAMLRAMDALGIEHALVSSLNAVHYFNPQDGNDELAYDIRNHRNRLTPLAVLRPGLAGWRDDAKRCADDYDMRGVVLYPNYHSFELEGEPMSAFVEQVESLHWPVFIQVGLEDQRRQYRPYKVQEVSPAAIGAFASAHPRVTVVALGLKFGQPEQAGEPLLENLLIELSNYEAMDEVEFAARTFGAEKLLFGTNMPLFNPVANVEKLGRANISETDRMSIGEGNVRRIMSL